MGIYTLVCLLPLPQEVLLDVTFPVDVVCLPVHLGAWNTQLGSWRSVRREGNQLVLCPVRTDTSAVCFGLRIVASLCSCSASSAQSTQLFYSSKTRRSLHALPPQPEHAGASQCSSTRSPADVVWHWTLWTRELQRTSCAVQSEGLLHRWPPRTSDQAEGCTLLSSPEPYRPHLSVPQTRLALREGRERRVYSRCLWPGGTAV